MKIPFMNLYDGFAPYKDEIFSKLQTLIEKTQFIGGDEVASFEQEFADFCGTTYAVGCSNGTDALEVVMRAFGIGTGDKVLVPANSFIASSEAVTLTGAEVDFVDVIDGEWTINPVEVESYLKSEKGSNVKAVLAVHLYGKMARMDQLRRICDAFDVYLIEDSAQAHGATYENQGPGCWGDAATFSFYPGKNLGAFGDAGAIVCNDKDTYSYSKSFVNHGREVGQKYEHQFEGANRRIDSIQAAILRIKLKYLQDATNRRITIAERYMTALSEVENISLPSVDENRQVYHLFVIHSNQRDQLQKFLRDKGIATGVHYPICLPFQPAYRENGYKVGDFPIAEKNAAQCLSLPLWPEMTSMQIDEVVEAIKSIKPFN
ncbi:DegT/DnrJ/EryC1/StrS family aminotransferase [Salinispira pacifica]|uniref:Aminotransferase n=1 Tax=Salinispira pacifica TaxID=1307761 RepID=V5WMR5_9SPIO|nr:DegT/DnrJ/EryC1/StrS family aminotransferase [Salinispira pacifica]AHC16481.1 Aminotransferase [Salinispira pacifica]